MKRVYQPRRPYDGIRIFVDKIWPRDLPAAAADVDEWCADIAPSTALLRWFGRPAKQFSEFRDRYLRELDHPARAEALARLCALTSNSRFTLLTAIEDIFTSPALVLAQRLGLPARQPLTDDAWNAVQPTTKPRPRTRPGSTS